MRKFMLFLVVLALLVFAVPALAQADAPPADDANPFTPLFVMAGAVFAVMELLKNSFLAPLRDRYGWSEQLYAALNWLIASALALVLLFGAARGMDIFTLSGYPNPFDDTFARIVTALFVGGGNAVLHALYDFLRAARGGVAVLALDGDD